MGTDRIQVYIGKCPCGSGVIEIDFCTPDHSYLSNSKWFQARMDCAKCNSIYSLEERGKYYGLIEKQEILKRKERYEKYKKAENNFIASKQAKKILQKLIELLDNQRSMAACHRILSGSNLICESYSTFRKHWESADSWLLKKISAEDLEKVLTVLEIKDDYISEGVSQLKKLWQEYKQPLPFYGKPLINTSKHI